jgi:hypothetical protein
VTGVQTCALPISGGKEEMKEVDEEIKAMSNSSFFYLIKR